MSALCSAGTDRYLLFKNNEGETVQDDTKAENIGKNPHFPAAAT